MYVKLAVNSKASKTKLDRICWFWEMHVRGHKGCIGSQIITQEFVASYVV